MAALPPPTYRVVLTSFRDAENWDGPKWSTARFQPKDCSYPQLPFLAPWDPDTHKKMVHLEPDVFREKYERLLTKKRFFIWQFISTRIEEEIVLLCWCHPDRQKKYDKLYCHTILLGHYLEETFPTLEIVYADGRDKPLWERDEPDF